MICIGLHHCQHFLAGTERRSRSTRWQWGPWGGASGRLAATARYLGLPTGPTCRVVGVRVPVGMAGLYGLAGAQRPWPSARPRTDASTPSHSASLSSKVATSAGDAPSVRARAESARRSRSTLHSAMDVVRNNFPYLHRRIWAHSVVARRLYSQLNKRLAPSRASQLLGAKRGVIPDHILWPSLPQVPTPLTSLRHSGPLPTKVVPLTGYKILPFSTQQATLAENTNLPLALNSMPCCGPRARLWSERVGHSQPRALWR